MILFLDSSALAKLYVEEPESPQVEQAVETAREVVVSTLALPEVVGGFRRRLRDGDINQDDSRHLIQEVLADWPKLGRIPVADHIAREAALLVCSKELRGADAVHLATVAALARERKGVRLLTYDKVMLAAAQPLVKLWNGS